MQITQITIVFVLILLMPFAILILRTHRARKQGKRLFPDWLPIWAERLFWFVGLPCWLGFAALILTGKLFDYEPLLLLAFAGFFASATVATFYAARATWRGER